MAIKPVSIDRISPTASVAAVSKVSADSDTRTIRTEINSKQQHMKKISSDDTITATEKEEKRRQLQKEIDELNRKLELKKQEQEEKAKEAAARQEKLAALNEETRKADALKKSDDSEMDKKKIESESSEFQKEEVNSEKEEPQRTDIPVKEIQEMLSSEYLLQKEQLQQQVNMNTENTIQVTKSEIDQDKRYGSDTTKKEAELEALEQKQNFWSDAQNHTAQTQGSANNQIQAQNTALNADVKVVIDQI